MSKRRPGDGVGPSGKEARPTAPSKRGPEQRDGESPVKAYRLPNPVHLGTGALGVVAGFLLGGENRLDRRDDLGSLLRAFPGLSVGGSHHLKHSDKPLRSLERATSVSCTCEQLRTLPLQLKGSHLLQKLELMGGPMPEECSVRALGNLPMLQSLSIGANVVVEDIQSLGHLESLCVRIYDEDAPFPFPVSELKSSRGITDLRILWGVFPGALDGWVAELLTACGPTLRRLEVIRHVNDSGLGSTARHMRNLRSLTVHTISNEELGAVSESCTALDELRIMEELPSEGWLAQFDAETIAHMPSLAKLCVTSAVPLGNTIFRLPNLTVLEARASSLDGAGSPSVTRLTTRCLGSADEDPELHVGDFPAVRTLEIHGPHGIAWGHSLSKTAGSFIRGSQRSFPSLRRLVLAGEASNLDWDGLFRAHWFVDVTEVDIRDMLVVNQGIHIDRVRQLVRTGKTVVMAFKHQRRMSMAPDLMEEARRDDGKLKFIASTAVRPHN